MSANDNGNDVISDTIELSIINGSSSVRQDEFQNYRRFEDDKELAQPTAPPLTPPQQVRSTQQPRNVNEIQQLPPGVTTSRPHNRDTIPDVSRGPFPASQQSPGNPENGHEQQIDLPHGYADDRSESHRRHVMESESLQGHPYPYPYPYPVDCYPGANYNSYPPHFPLAPPPPPWWWWPHMMHFNQSPVPFHMTQHAPYNIDYTQPWNQQAFQPPQPFFPGYPSYSPPNVIGPTLPPVPGHAYGFDPHYPQDYSHRPNIQGESQTDPEEACRGPAAFAAFPGGRPGLNFDLASLPLPPPELLMDPAELRERDAGGGGQDDATPLDGSGSATVAAFVIEQPPSSTNRKSPYRCHLGFAIVALLFPLFGAPALLFAGA